MVAVLAPTSLTAPASAPAGRPGPERRPVGARPALRVIEGGRADRRPTQPGQVPAGVYLRRRILVGAVALTLLAVLVVGVWAAASLLAAPVTPTTPPASSALGSPIAVGSPIAATTYVVRPGDTLWSIAARLDPNGDPRPVVDALRERAGGAALEAGQRIDVSDLGA